ncbi:hypothetical protein BDV37DRAFT_120937 [Aspergillus pseudonomiae]|uniref:Uncharacterized protein n=1 Tax=Aspergillus pseudonomiae TaxID=1506151 RepID=A0A5N7DC42_9EURO|nr:uncharacterized protein BDV37DRAFT_120937 [Aspergillus pseudonomiae]KAE8403961.1 hypothetical protein BDV37DRAFT_120937 [Aspergillus pseudonomiae]
MTLFPSPPQKLCSAVDCKRTNDQVVGFNLQRKKLCQSQHNDVVVILAPCIPYWLISLLFLFLILSGCASWRQVDDGKL